MKDFKHILVISRMIPYSREAIKGMSLGRLVDRIYPDVREHLSKEKV